MRTFTRTFLTGLATILPITITIYVLYWLGSTAESMLGPLLKKHIPEGYYVPGLGVVAGVALVFVIGVLMKAWLFRSFVALSERVLQRIPLVKTLYKSVRDLMGFFTADAKAKGRMKAVVVTVGGTDARLLGFITREDFADLPAALGSHDTVAVFLPMSYQMGGFTAMVPRSAVTPIDMTLEEAMRFALTAGMAIAKDS